MKLKKGQKVKLKPQYQIINGSLQPKFIKEVFGKYVTVLTPKVWEEEFSDDWFSIETRNGRYMLKKDWISIENNILPDYLFKIFLD